MPPAKARSNTEPDPVPPRADKSFYETWLRRTRRQLSASGRLSQVAQVLATDTGDTATFWSARLRDLLEGTANPTLEELIRIEGLLATPRPPSQRGQSLFLKI